MLTISHGCQTTRYCTPIDACRSIASVPGRISQSAVCIVSLDVLSMQLMRKSTAVLIFPALYITAARLVWGFAFSNPPDPAVNASTGAEVLSLPVPLMVPDASMETGYTSGFNCLPRPFSCVVVPRCQGVREVCLREEEEAREGLRVFEDYYD